MNRIYFAIILLCLSCGMTTAQSKENEELKAAVERAFAPKKEAPTQLKPSASADGALYYVQLFYSKSHVPAEVSKAEGYLGKITRYTHNGYFKYCAGGYSDKSQADEMTKRAKKAGYTSAFVIKLKDGNRID